MSTINSTTAANGSIPASATRNPRSQLKVEDFINMMVTQLQNQDPMEPAKNEALLAQMSQIGQLQSQQSLQESLKTLVFQNNLGSAGAMIGKVIKGQDSSGQVSGMVTSVKVDRGDIFLELDSGRRLKMSDVTEIVAGQNLTRGGTVAGT